MKKLLLVAAMTVALTGCPWEDDDERVVYIPVEMDDKPIDAAVDDQGEIQGTPASTGIDGSGEASVEDSAGSGSGTPTDEDAGMGTDEGSQSGGDGETTNGDSPDGQPDTPDVPQEPSGADWREEMLTQINATRAVGRNCGAEFYPAVPPVTLNETLNLAAQWHSEDMASQNYFSHTGLDGRDPGQRISDAGYNWRTYGENIAAGYDTVTETMTQWINSPGHCANLMNPSFQEVGLGMIEMSGNRYGIYWTQNFGTHR